MISADALIEAVFKVVRHYALKAQVFSQKIETMNNDEIYPLLNMNKLAFIKNAQEQLLQLKVFHSSLVLSMIGGVITKQDCADMEASYTQKILQLDAEISKLKLQTKVIARHIDETVKWLKEISKLAGRDSFERVDIVRLIGSITVFKS